MPPYGDDLIKKEKGFLDRLQIAERDHSKTVGPILEPRIPMNDVNH